jgi:hypothetical protein
MVTVPLINSQDSLNNLVIGVTSNSGKWRYRLINRQYYKFKLANSKYQTNKYYYASLINIFDEFEHLILDGCNSNPSEFNVSSPRCEDWFLCGDGFQAIIDCETGVMVITVMPQPCESGGSGGGSYPISTVYVGGTPYSLPGSSGDIFNESGGYWNPNEDSGISWPSDEFGGGNIGGGGSGSYGFNGQDFSFCMSMGLTQISDFDAVQSDLNDYLTENNLSQYFNVWDLLQFIQPACVNVHEFDFANCIEGSFNCFLENSGVNPIDDIPYFEDIKTLIDFTLFAQGTSLSTGYLNSFINYLESIEDLDFSSEHFDWIFESDENVLIALELLEFLEEEDLPNEFATFAFEVFLEDFSETTSIEGLIDISLNPNDYRTRMSESELALFDSMSYLNQLRYLYSAYQAESRASSLYPGIDNLRNGLGDAYRHALWNALGAKRLGNTVMEQLATAHEDIEPDYEYRFKEQEMDLFNNDVGRSLSNQSGKLWQVVKSSLEAGDLRYLHPRGLIIDGVYFSFLANEQSELIPTNQ